MNLQELSDEAIEAIVYNSPPSLIRLYAYRLPTSGIETFVNKLNQLIVEASRELDALTKWRDVLAEEMIRREDG